jgi:hypothetical protein
LGATHVPSFVRIQIADRQSFETRIVDTKM